MVDSGMKGFVESARILGVLGQLQDFSTLRKSIKDFCFLSAACKFL